MNIDNNHLVIMAGGVGIRFWPMSTTDYPKQFIDVLGCGRTLIQLTYDRFEGLCPAENIWVVTSDKYATEVKKQLPDIKDDHILREPCRRNTAPCIAYVSWKIKSINPKANMVVTPSDHVVMDVREFQRVINSALKFTNNSDAILTLGMKPTRPETGYGYIEADLSYPSNYNKEIYRVDSFKEKPDLATAEKYIKKPSYFWNAGIFVWNVNTVVNSLRVYQPAISKIFERLLPYYYTDQEQTLINEQFPLCESISIDYAIMEKAENVYVQLCDFGWADLGTWGSLHDASPKDMNHNVIIKGHTLLYDCKNNIVALPEGKLAVLQGLDDYLVADTDNVLLVCRKDDENTIRRYVNDTQVKLGDEFV